MKPLRTPLLEGSFADLRGRGARSNRETRFAAATHEADPDYLEFARAEGESGSENAPAARIRTSVTIERARSIISRNDSPDIPFDRSVNPYRGCEHGCVYCYARPTHAYLGLSPGVDFETRIFAKTNAAELLDRELRKPGYAPAPLALGANTDPYQPVEEHHGITRSVLEVLAEFGHPVTITTKSARVLRDLDLLREMARQNLVRVHLSIATLDRELARRLEPRACTPERRLAAIRGLSDAGVPAEVFVSPMIPALTDPDMESVLEAAAGAGAQQASFVVLRLPLEIRDLFVEWLEEFYPQRAAHVMSLVRQMRGGKDNVSEFGERMRGSGQYADLLRQRFSLARRRFGLTAQRVPLDCSRFRVPAAVGPQQSLF